MEPDDEPEPPTLAAPPRTGDALPGATSAEDAPPLLAGRYGILGMLGAGAMGTVYRARDRELDETVALKVLKRDVASPVMLERFRREVKLARRVTHRNVARTYDIGEHGGERFLTMEFIEGEMLGSLLARKRTLTVGAVVGIALDVCAGLSAAHAAQVLHRDLKPENVILAADGRAVITDFGIARALSGAAASGTINVIAGTPAYMAPEQVEGAADLDERADLYALGAMLYELLTGAPAWDGDSVIAIAVARLHRPPPDPRFLCAALAPALAELVVQLMARRREDRPASAAETAARLTPFASRHVPDRASFAMTASVTGLPRLPFARSARGARVIAVLPLLNLGAPDDAYLADSAHEDLVDLLSVVPGLLVRARGETAAFLDPRRDVRAIGAAVAADVVVDGSLRRVGDTLRVSFRLIAVADGLQLWARRFDRRPETVLSMANDAAEAIARALTAPAPRSGGPRDVDPRAEELFLRGRHVLRTGWLETAREAVELLSQANALAPGDPRVMGTYALALARVYGSEFFGRDVAAQVRALASEATLLDAVQPGAHVALALVMLQDGDAEAAVAHFRAAFAVAPNSIDALDWFGRLLAEVGRTEPGIALLSRAAEIDPDLVQARHHIARIRGLLGDRAGLTAALGPIPSRQGDVVTWFLVQARNIVWYRDVESARGLLRLLDGRDIAGAARVAIEGLLSVTVEAEAGDRVARAAAIERYLPIAPPLTPRRVSFNAQLRTELFLASGLPAEAVAALRAADGSGLLDVVWFDGCPLLDAVRGDPEVSAIRARVSDRAARVAAVIDAHFRRAEF